MTGDDPTRDIPWHEDAEAAGTTGSRHCYPRPERDRVDEIAGPVERQAWWLSVAFWVALVAAAVLLVVFGGGHW